jgi:hypothetical protein
MNITKKHLATLNSVATHIYVDGGRILFSAEIDWGNEGWADENIKYVDSHNCFCIDGEIDEEWIDALSREDRVTFHRYRRIAKAQTKDIRYTNILKTFSPIEILINKIALS